MGPHDRPIHTESPNEPDGGRSGFSIICAFNDREKLDGFLLQSLRAQSAPFEILTIDNRLGSFKSAPRILNETAAHAKFDHFLFAHQDVALRGSTWLNDVRKTLETLGTYGAAGVAGHAPGGFKASVLQGHPPRFVCPKRVEQPQPVQTLDGCLLIVPRRVFLEQGFDEETCRGWHLYVADYCLDLARRRLPVYVLPQEVYHESPGPSDPGVYAATLDNLRKKHRDHVKRIYTTIGIWDA